MEKDQGNGVPQKIMDGMDSLRKDLGYAPSLMAATSSSSKVSGSHKSKGNFHEVKGSPVESVSSSPLRISNTDKPTSKRNLLVKDEPTMAFSTVGSPKRCSDNEADGGNNRFRTTNKAKAASVILHETLATNGDGEASMLGSSEGALCHRDMDANQISGTKTKENMHLKAFIGTHSNHFPPEFQDVNIENGDAITSDQVIQCEHDRNNPCPDQEKPCSCHINGSTQQEPKSNSLRAKNRKKTVKPEFERGRGKVSDSFSGQEDNPYSKNANDFRYGSGMDPHGQSPYHEELRDEKCKFQVKSFNIHVKDQNNFIGREVTVGNTLSKGGKMARLLLVLTKI
ncbi:hypothetical protein QJS10_CPB04g00788 [Acorus calamus]|uniref:Uncharacterized protein n=1 Tax=Acorus calamus TaxID=4465 RepID=A0AAV9EYY0_ACOCL|nr:hypothetical protein QJS10_CPB04g00788 [Acorus calamus]